MSVTGKLDKNGSGLTASAECASVDTATSISVKTHQSRSAKTTLTH